MHYQLKDLEIPFYLGVYASEKTGPQTLKVSLIFEADSKGASASDNLADAIDYAQIENYLRSFSATKHYNLLEHLHAKILSGLKTEFPQLKNLQLQLQKFPFESGSVLVSN